MPADSPNVLSTPTPLKSQIQTFYDDSSQLWEQVWGEHMHHGYYESGQVQKDRRQAQIDLIDRLLAWADVRAATHILDVGCGIGGSTLDLVRRFQARGTGITLSPVQANRARARAYDHGLSDRTTFLVADALSLPFADQTFDLVWTLESGEHMADKRQFLQECYRVLRPGGRLLMATWCHRPGSLSPLDYLHLQAIYFVYYLPYIISLPEYITIAQGLGLTQIQTDEWSQQVAPFWDLVIDSALDPSVIISVLSKGWMTIQGALALPLMSQGYASGLIQYGVLTGVKGH